MATMELASIPRELPQFGRHLSSLARPASEVFGQQGRRNGKGSCGCGGGKGSCGCGGKGSTCGTPYTHDPGTLSIEWWRATGIPLENPEEKCCCGQRNGAGKFAWVCGYDIGDGWIRAKDEVAVFKCGSALDHPLECPECDAICWLNSGTFKQCCRDALRTTGNKADFDAAVRTCRDIHPDYDKRCPQPPCPIRECAWQEHSDLKCGGDVTDLMMEEIQRSQQRPAEDSLLGYHLDYFICITSAAAALVSNLNWKETPPKGKDCASQDCKKTLSICGKCLNDSAPANIMFGAMMKACGMANADIISWARRAKKWHAREPEKLPPWDAAAITLGADLLSDLDKEGFCRAVLARTDLQGPDNPACKKAAPCA